MPWTPKKKPRQSRLAIRTACFMGVIGTATLLEAANLEQLTRLLVPAFMVSSYTAVCTARDPSFLSGTAIRQDDIQPYVRHVREEVFADLPVNERNEILLTAANTAKQVGIREMRNFGENSNGSENERLGLWCKKSAKPFVVTIIESHYAKHSEFEQRVRDAKRL